MMAGRGDLERGFRSLHIGMGKIDEDAQPIVFPDDGCPEWGQSAEARRVGVNVAQRHGSVAVVKQPKMPQAPPVGFFHPLKMALKRVAAFDRLDDRWLAILMGGAHVIRSDGTLHAVALQLPINRRQPFEKPVVGITGLVVSRKGRADGFEARPLHLAGQVYIWSRHFGGGEGNVDVIMGVDPDSLGDDVGHPRIGYIRRPA
jgi:hypothetical protein